MPPDRIAAPQGRMVVVWLSLVSYGLVMTGLPMPTASPGVQAGSAFPCQGHACGCRSAAECWRACCCFSVAERVAWARQHRVEPPELVRIATTHAEPLLRSADRCESPSTETCCSIPPSADRNDCRESPTIVPAVAPSEGLAASRPVPHDAIEPREGRSGWVLGVQALKCRGLGAQWTSLGMPIGPPPELVRYDLDTVPAGPAVLAFAPLRSHSSPPAVPPG